MWRTGNTESTGKCNSRAYNSLYESVAMTFHFVGPISETHSGWPSPLKRLRFQNLTMPRACQKTNPHAFLLASFLKCNFFKGTRTCCNWPIGSSTVENSLSWKYLNIFLYVNQFCISERVQTVGSYENNFESWCHLQHMYWYCWDAGLHNPPRLEIPSVDFKHWNTTVTCDWPKNIQIHQTRTRWDS